MRKHRPGETIWNPSLNMLVSIVQTRQLDQIDVGEGPLKLLTEIDVFRPNLLRLLVYCVHQFLIVCFHILIYPPEFNP